MYNKQNNFATLRHIAALLVIFAHSFDMLKEWEYQSPFFENTIHISAGTVGVDIFFMISGFLIAQSWLKKPKVGQFFSKRVTRLLPALLVNTIILFLWTAFIFTNGEVSRFFHDKAAYNIFLYATIFKYPPLPDYILTGAFFHSLNGSLWTLRYEVISYCTVPLFLLLGGAISRYLKLQYFIALLVFVLIIGYIIININRAAYLQTLPILNSLNIYLIFGNLFELVLPFYLGVLFYVNNWKQKMPYWLAILGLLFLIFIPYTKPFSLLVYMAAIYSFTFWLAYHKSLFKVSKWFEKRDYSYGLYIYAFPVQQSIIYLNKGNFNPYLLFLLSTIITLAFAIFSWHVIEQPSMNFLKRRLALSK